MHALQLELQQAIGSTFAFQERDLLKLLAPQLERWKKLPVEDRAEFAVASLEEMRARGEIGYVLDIATKAVTTQLLRGVTLPPDQALRAVQAVSQRRRLFPYKAVLKAIESQSLTMDLRAALHALKPEIDEWHGGPQCRELHERIDAILQAAFTPIEKPITPASTWSGRVFADFSGTIQREKWFALFRHAQDLSQSTPSKKWLATAAEWIGAIGEAEFLHKAEQWLAYGPMPDLGPIQMPDAEAEYQKGFVWAVAVTNHPPAAGWLADHAVACYKKIPMIGAVSQKVGNACVGALAAIPHAEAVAQLSRLGQRIKYDVAQRLIEKALVQAADAQGVSREDLETMNVPRFGLNAAVDAALATDAEVGVALATMLKANYPEAPKEFKKAEKELATCLTTQRLRLERMLLHQNTCSIDNWRQWYLEHPILSTLAKRLIWQFDDRPGMPRNGRIVDWAGAEVATQGTTVRLWHPATSDAQTIFSWRCFLEDNHIQQPFKQAHREIYILTGAERETATYSNRFANHILKQHVFAALCRERGWDFRLMGVWDSHNTPTLALPRFGLFAEFDVDFPANEEVSGHAIYLLIATGQVRFRKADGTPVPLEQIDSIVFSEILRDIDLFVGVCSIGSDPAWGAEATQQHREYWNVFSFGALTQAAENRKEIVAGLLPKLAIAGQCRIDGRFLVVRGSLREYHIHLGSGNVRMEPGSQYLCIVQGAGDKAGSVFLPFAGDRILAQILSKALLLAADAKIKDPSILKQIQH